MARYLIIGQGAIGLSVAVALNQQGNQVTTVARTAKNYPNMAIEFWQKDALTLTSQELEPFSHIAIIITPTSHTDRTQAYKDSYLAVCQHIANTKNPLTLKQLLFVSSTSVYGQNAGELIDEHTPAHPSSDTAKVLRQAEQVLQNRFKDKCVIVRPSGIYGKQRTYMIHLAKNAHIDGVSDSHMTNRIMDSDLVAVLCDILQNPKPKNLYLATDFEPATIADVISFICQQKNYPPPKMIASTPTGKKIISNLPKTSLQFTSYQQGYADILSDDSI